MRVRRLKNQTEHSPLSSAEARNTWKFTLTAPCFFTWWIF